MEWEGSANRQPLITRYHEGGIETRRTVRHDLRIPLAIR